MPDPQATVQPRKKPAQARSRATVEAILEAATRILRDQGLADLTTNRVAERAGVSVGSLYQYFPSREAILAELVRRLRREYVAACEAPSYADVARLVDQALDAKAD